MSLSQAASYTNTPDKLITLEDRQVSIHPNQYVSKAGGRRKSTCKNRKQSRKCWPKKRGGSWKKNKTYKPRKH